MHFVVSMHAFPSWGGTSVSSTTDTLFPFPSHCSSRQSPSVCSVGSSGVPAAVLVLPQTPAMHVRGWQKESAWSVHWSALTQAEHEPDPSQVASGEHTVPVGLNVAVGVPSLVQLPSEQTLGAGGVLVMSTKLTSSPAPSQRISRQFPSSCTSAGPGVPTGWLLNPQRPAVHVIGRQKDGLPGHSLAVVHPEHCPRPLHIRPSPHAVPLGVWSNEGVPFEQRPSLQGLSSLGRLESSLTV